jgi:hypothetical protein
MQMRLGQLVSGVAAACLAICLSPAVGSARTHWQVLDTPSFRIMHENPKLAAKVAKEAERSRVELIRFWKNDSSHTPPAWSPRCDIYLFGSNRELVLMTGGKPKAGSALAKQARLMHGRVFYRRINLSADDVNLMRVTLPHEVNHIVVKDFGVIVPRWADEGMAMVAESDRSALRRARSLRYAVKYGPFFRAKTLMRMRRYPGGGLTLLYYAQSFALTRFFLERGGPKRFFRFLRMANKQGHLTALRRFYRIASYRELERGYLAYAKKLATSTVPRRLTWMRRRSLRELAGQQL